MVTSLRLPLLNADFRGKGHTSSLALLPDFEDNLFAAYVFVEDREGGAGLDLSGHGRHADVSGAEVLSNHLRLGLAINKKVVYPFTGTDIAAANNAYSVAVVAKVPTDVTSYLVGSIHGSEDAQQLIVDANNNGRASIYSGGSLTHTILNNGAPDPERATRYEMFAASYTTSRTGVYRRHAEGVLESSIFNVSKTIGGSRKLASGINSLGTNYPGPYDHAATVFVDREVSLAEWDDIYEGLQAYETIFDIDL